MVGAAAAGAADSRLDGVGYRRAAALRAGIGGEMEVLRTPDERFETLPGFDLEPHYTEINGLRVHYLDEGPAEAAPMLLLHGEPSWCYLYRKMVPVLTAAGLRAVAPHLIGFGRSDKPASRGDYTYQLHVDVVAAFVQ